MTLTTLQGTKAEFLLCDYFDMPEPEIAIDELPKKLPSGKYQGQFLGHETKLDFGGSPKLYLYFSIVRHGSEIARLYKVYPVKKLIGPPRINGGYHIGAESNVNKDLRRLWEACGFSPSSLRKDRPSFRFLQKRKLELTVVEVVRDHKGEPRSADRIYSKVDRIDVVDFY